MLPGVLQEPGALFDRKLKEPDDFLDLLGIRDVPGPKWDRDYRFLINVHQILQTSSGSGALMGPSAIRLKARGDGGYYGFPTGGSPHRISVGTASSPDG